MTQSEKKGWWSRNWKWFVPMGCLGLILLAVLGVGSILYLVFSMIRSSDVVQTAVAQAEASAVVTETLGSPLEVGLLVTGNISVSGPSGRASLSIPLSGPNGKATLYVDANRTAGQWQPSSLIIQFKEDGSRVDLLLSP